MVPRPLRDTMSTGNLKRSNQVDQQIPVVERDQHASRTLDDPAATGHRRAERAQRLERNGSPAQLRGQVRRHRARQPNPLVEDAPRTAAGQPLHFGRVVILFDAGLDRLPVLEGQGAIATDQRSGHDGLADVRIRAGYEDPAEQSPASFSAAASDTAKRSIVSSDNPALTETRSRAVPGGTLGGRMARTSKPSA